MATAKSTCSIEGCDNPVSARKMCDPHYRRVRDTGTPHRPCKSCGKDMFRYPSKAKYCSEECRICKIENCQRSIHCKDMCAIHYRRWRNGYRMETVCETCGIELPKFSGQALYCSPECRPHCKVEGCVEPYRSEDGYCSRHKALVRRYGKPEGEYEWTPKADKYTCVVCGTTFTESNGRRKHCSNNCQVLDSTYQGNTPTLDFDCAMCGQHFKRNRKDALHQRSDKKLCDRCRLAKNGRHRSSPGALALRDGPDCGICGEPVDMMLKHPSMMRGSVDHIIPVALGGAVDDPKNLQLSHLRCNVTKQARMDYQPA